LKQNKLDDAELYLKLATDQALESNIKIAALKRLEEVKLKKQVLEIEKTSEKR
jgi:hypothetical protein